MIAPSAAPRMLARDPAAAAADPTDFTPTPAPVARAMAMLEPWGPKVWDPGCGDGAITGQFLRRGHSVVETDIVPRGVGRPLDFLTCQQLLAPEIVMNPPFNRGTEFVDHALNLGADKVMALLPLGWMQRVTEPGRSLVTRRGLATVWVSIRRIPFLRGGWDAGNGGGPVHKHALYVWQRGFVGAPVLRFFDWQDFA